MEIFANMEIALLSDLNSDDVVEALSPEPWNNAMEQPGDTSFGTSLFHECRPVRYS